MKLRPASLLIFMVGLISAKAASADDWLVCRSGVTDVAIAACTHVLALDDVKLDRKVDALVRRGKAFLQKDEFSEAVNDFNAAIALQPLSGAAYFARGRAREKRGLYALAKRDFEQAIALFESETVSSPPAVFETGALPGPERIIELPVRKPESIRKKARLEPAPASPSTSRTSTGKSSTRDRSRRVPTVRRPITKQADSAQRKSGSKSQARQATHSSQVDLSKKDGASRFFEMLDQEGR